MSRVLLMAALACVGLLLAEAGEARQQSLATSGPVTALAAASNDGRGHHVAFVVRDRGCDVLQVWRLTRAPQTLAPRDCRSAIFGLSMSDYGALWGTLARRPDGERVFEVWRASSGWARGGGFSTPYGPRVRLFRRLVPAGEPSPLVMGDGVYSVDSKLYWFTGMRARDIPPLAYRPVRIYALGTVVVLAPTGELERYDSAPSPSEPRPQATFDFLPGSVKAIRDGVVLEPGRLSLWYGHFSGFPYHVPMPAAASYGDDRCYEPPCRLSALRLADKQGPYVIYVFDREIHVLRLRDDEDRVLSRPPTGPVHAQMEPGGVTYSAGNRVYYMSREQVDALFVR